MLKQLLRKREKSIWTHEETYKGFGLSKIVHRSRLKKILALFDTISISPIGNYADFGCSNGFIIEMIYKKFLYKHNWKIIGFDNSSELLELAKMKELPDTEFLQIDLNQYSLKWENKFDIVTSFETLEHVGNYKNAIKTIFDSCKNGDTILLSIPNEKGLPGLIKYISRKILRKNAYGNFFENKSEIKYVLHLLTNKPIESFRLTDSNGFGSHLGFDWKMVEKSIKNNFIETKKYELCEKQYCFFKFNIVYVIKKLH